MIVKFMNEDVIAIEFNHSFIDIDGLVVQEINMLIDVDIDEVEEIFSPTFMLTESVENYSLIYQIFRDWELSEYFEEEGLVRIICIKK